MSLLISPKLIPLIEYSTTGEYDRWGHWIPDLLRLMVIKNKWGDVLEVQGNGLMRRLHKIATIYRNAGEKISAVPRELLSVPAIAEVGCLRGTNYAKNTTGLLFQMNTAYLREWDIGQYCLSDYEIKWELPGRGIVSLTPSIVIKNDGFFLATPNSEREQFEGDYSYDELVEHEFAIDE